MPSIASTCRCPPSTLDLLVALFALGHLMNVDDVGYVYVRGIFIMISPYALTPFYPPTTTKTLMFNFEQVLPYPGNVTCSVVQSCLSLIYSGCVYDYLRSTLLSRSWLEPGPLG